MTDTPFEIERARHDTQGCAFISHFNNAGASLMPRSVLERIQDHLNSEAVMGGYEAAQAVTDEIDATYQTLGTLINAKPDEIAVLENATRAWEIACYSIPFKPGDRIITHHAEYGSNYLAFLQIAKKTGAIVNVVPDDAFGQISLDALSKMLDERVKLISITHVPTHNGVVNPIEKIGKLANAIGAIFIVDACQTIGQIPIDVNKIGCHILAATGRKYLRGPRGTGFLYVNEAVIEQLEPPFLNLHAVDWIGVNNYKIRKDAKRFETWEINIATKLGLGAAATYALSWGIENIWSRIQEMANYFRIQLNNIPGVAVRDKGEIQCGIVTFTVQGKTPAEICNILKKHHFNVTIRTRIQARLDMEVHNLDDVVRASIHYYNTTEEIDEFCDIISKSGNRRG